MFREKFEHKVTVNPLINTQEMEFTALEDYVGKKIRVYGFFFNESKFGKQVVVVSTKALINMPKRCVADFESLTEEEIKAVMDGGMVLTNIKPFTSKQGKTIVFDYDDIAFHSDLLNDKPVSDFSDFPNVE